MRKHARHGWQWTRTYALKDTSARYTVARRAQWDLRCEESPCTLVHGRMSARMAPKRSRRRSGGRYR